MSVPLEGDDITQIIEEHRDELPFSDQLPSFDPPKHTAHRGLLMRLITPKRLKENEAFLWSFADQTIDKFIDARASASSCTTTRCPYTLMVIADLLGVPDDDRDAFLEHLTTKVRAGTRMEHKPLGFLYEQFTRYIEDRRANPRDDVMTEMAQATFPDGTLPPVEDVMRIAANLFSAGSETTARLIGDVRADPRRSPRVPAAAARRPRLIAPFVEEMLRTEAPLKGSFKLAKVRTTVGGVELAAGHHGVRDDRRREPRPPPVRRPGRVPARPAQRPPAPGVRQRHPQLRRRAARPGRDPRDPRALPRAHVRHPDLGGAPRPRPTRGATSTTRPTCCAGCGSSTSSSIPPRPDPDARRRLRAGSRRSGRRDRHSVAGRRPGRDRAACPRVGCATPTRR